jgi:hypothetical protein
LRSGGVATKPSSKTANALAMEVVVLLIGLKETVRFVRNARRKRLKFKLHMMPTRKNCR